MDLKLHNFADAKVGDKAWVVPNGWGSIVYISTKSNLPIHIIGYASVDEDFSALTTSDGRNRAGKIVAFKEEMRLVPASEKPIQDEKLLDEKIAKYEALKDSLETNRILYKELRNLIYGEILDDLNQIRKVFVEKQKCCSESGAIYGGKTCLE